MALGEIQYNKKNLVDFLIKARANTYAGGEGKVAPAFPGGYQLEYQEGDWLYRDFYNLGNAIFIGLETVYLKSKPVWSNCYYGNFKGMTEEETDKILRRALTENKDTRLWRKIEWEKDGFTYLCIPKFKTGIDEVSGTEEIYKGKEKIYFFSYAGGFVG